MTQIGMGILLLILTSAGLWLVAGGTQLLFAGGSGYYLLAGVALLWTAIALFRRRGRAPQIYAALLFSTLIWSLCEVGLDGWALAPRVLALATLGLLFFCTPVRALSPDGGRWLASAILAINSPQGSCCYCYSNPASPSAARLGGQGGFEQEAEI